MRISYNNDSYFDSNVTNNGSYAFTLPSAGEYRVKFRQDGGATPFADDGVPGVYAHGDVLVSGNTSEDFSLPTAHDLTVKVVDQSGTVVPNASVDVRHVNEGTSVGAYGETNADGLFVPNPASDPGIEAVGSMQVRADAAGYAETVVETTVTNATTVTVQLRQAATIDGTIEGANGQAAAADKVEFDIVDDSAGNTTWTDDNGSFAATVADGETYEAEFVQTASSNDYRASFPQDGLPDLYALGTVDAGESLGTVSLPEPSNLTVTVVGPDGDALGDVPVNVHHQSGDSDAFARTTTDANGTVTLEAAEEIRVTADPDRSGIGRASTEVTVGTDTHVTLQLPEVVTASGDLAASNGASLTGEQVLLVNGYDASTEVGADGSYETEVAVNGDYDVVFRQYDYRADEYYPKDGVPDIYAVQNVSVGTGNVSLGSAELPNASRLNVTVLDESGQPVSGVPVYVQHESGDATAFARATTNDGGQLVLDRATAVGVEANGTLELHVEPDDAGLPYLDADRTVEVTQDQAITITVDSAADLNGSVQYRDGSTPDGYTVSAHGDGSGDSAELQATGDFALSVSPNAQYEVLFKQFDWDDAKPAFPKDNNPDLYAIGTVEVGNSSKSLGNATLPAANRLDVTVVNESGAPVAGADVDVVHVNGDASVHHGASTNQNGSVVLDGAKSSGIEAVGEVRVSVTAPDGSDLGDATRTYTVTADRNETITLSGQVPVSGKVTYADGTNASGYVAELFGYGGEYQLTNGDGSFRLLVEPNRTYRLGFKQTDLGGDAKPDFPKDGRPDVHTFGSIALDTESVDVGTQRLPAAHVVNVTVVNQSGAPVSGLDVDVMMLTDEPYPGVHSPASTDANGAVVLSGAASPGIEANGTMRVVVQGTDTYLRAVERRIEVNRSRNVTITLEPSVDVDGRYLDSDGNPLNDSRVTAWPVPENRWYISGIGDTGEFQLPVAANDTYQLGFSQYDADGNFGPHDGVVDLYRTTEVTVGSENATVGTHEIPDAAGLVNVRVVNESGAPVQGARVAFFPANGDNATRALGWVEPTNANGYYTTGDRRGIELNGSTKIRISPPSDSDAFVPGDVWRNVTVTGDRNITVTLDERAGSNQVAVTWTTPNGTAVSNVEAFLINFVDYQARGETNASGTFSREVPADADPNLSAYVAPLDTGDGVVDAWNVPLNASGGADVTEQLPRGYEVSVSATTATGETADTIVRVTNNVNASAAGWYYEYGTGRALDAPQVGPDNRSWRHAKSRDLASGTHNVTVVDAWTHDRLAERVVPVNDAAKTVHFDVDRYPSIDQSTVEPGTVARDIESPTLGRDTTAGLLANGFNVRLTAFGTGASTNLTVTERLPDGYVLDQSYANDSGPVGVSYDGTGSVTAAYDTGTNTLTLEVSGNVSDVRYRVDAVDNGSEVATFAGDADGEAVRGESYLGEAPLSGTIALPDGSAAEDAVVVARPLGGTATGTSDLTAADGRYLLPVSLGEQYGVGYYERADRDGQPRRAGSPDIFSVGVVDVREPTTLNASLPAAHDVTFEVVDSDGDPVDNGSVDLTLSHHVAGFDSAAPARVERLRVDDDGLVLAGNGSTTWELVGNVTLSATPESDTGRFTGDVTRNVTVTSDRTVTVTLPEEQQPPNATVSANETDVVTGDSVFVTARNSTDNAGIAAANWTITGPDGSTRTATGPNVTVEANASGNWTVTVTVVDVAGNEDAATTTVTASDPANVTTDYSFGANASDGEVTTAETVTLTANVTNDGDRSTTETVALDVDGEVVDERNVTLAGGESKTVSFTTSLSRGTHDVGVRGVGTTALSVLEPADIAVTYDVAGTEVFLSDVLYVTANVSNDGGVSGTKEVALRVDNGTVATTNVTVGAGERRTVEFTYRFGTVGTYDVAVDDLPATPVTAAEATNLNASVSVDAPAEDAVVGDAVTVEYALSNASTGIQAVVYRVDGQDRQTVADGLNASAFEVTNLNEGPRTVTMWLRDNAGNLVAKTTRQVTVDTTAPSVGAKGGDGVVGPAQTAEVNVTVQDATLNETTAALVDGNGTVVETVDLTDRAADGQATVSVDASANGSQLASGTYGLSVTATDATGRTTTARADVIVVDTTAPEASSLDITGTTTTAGTDYLNASGALTVSGTVTDAGDANVSTATVVLVSQGASYNATETVALAADGSFDATLSLGDAPAGEYQVAVRATDSAGNALVAENVSTFTYDDAAPTLGVSVSAVNATDGRVRVTTDEPLTAAPTVTIDGPADSSTVAVTETAPGVYTATFEFGDFGNDGRYAAAATGTDRAGQSVTVTSNTSVQTNVRVENGSALVETGDGAFINLSLNTSAVSDGVASLSTSDTPLAELDADLNGSQFVEGELGAKLSRNLTSAEIGIPRSEVSVPPGVNDSEIEIRRFDESTGKWASVGDTSVETRTVNGTQRTYVVLTVSHFSTYGAVAADSEAPSIDDVTLSAAGRDTGTTYSYSTDDVTTTVAYSDDIAGINESAVEVSFNGKPVDQQSTVTADVTSDDVTVTATGLTGSGTNTVTVVTEDETGKTTKNVTTFTVERDDTGPTLETDDVTDGETLDYGTTTKTLAFTYEDARSGVNASSVTVVVDGTPLPAAETVVDDGRVEFDVTGLSPGASRSVSVTVADDAGNAETVTRAFSVALDTTGPSVRNTTYSASGTETTPPLSASTAAATTTLDIGDGESGVDATAITVRFGEANATLDTVTSNALVTGSTVEYTATDLEAETTYVLNATLVDEAGNVRTVERTFRVAADATAPTVTGTTFTPSASTDSPTFDPSTADVTTELSVTDDAAVNASAVVVQFGEQGTTLQNVTSAATVTGDVVRYGNDSLEPGTTYELSVTLVDESGNERTVTRTFTVAADTTAPVVTDTTFSPTASATDPTFEAGTETVSVALSAADDTDLNESAVVVRFGERGELGPVNADVSDGTVSYDATGLTDGTTYELEVTLVDESGNERTVTRTFSVASSGGDDDDVVVPGDGDDGETTTTTTTTDDDDVTTTTTTDDDDVTTTTTTDDDGVTTTTTTDDDETFTTSGGDDGDESDTTTVEDGTTTDDESGGSIPGFTGLTAIAALAAAAVLVHRRREAR